MNAPAYPLLRDAVEHARLAQQAQFWSADAAALFETAGLAAGGRVADLGCGTLHVAQMLNRFVGPAGTVFALDSDAAVLGADPSTGDAARVIVTHGDAYASPWDDGSLDAVHARFLAAPAGRIDALIGEMRRLVRPGGLILMQEPVTHSWHVRGCGRNRQDVHLGAVLGHTLTLQRPMTMALSLSIRAVVVRRTGETSALTTTPPGTPKEAPWQR